MTRMIRRGGDEEVLTIDWIVDNSYFTVVGVPSLGRFALRACNCNLP